MAGTALAVMLAGCAYEGLTMPTSPFEGDERPLPAAGLFGTGTLTAPGPDAKAVTYNPELAPIGAAITVIVTPFTDRTGAYLTASGLVPNRSYGAHLHANACGATPDAAGPHFQHRVDPAATPQAPSTNPEYANPQNEFWLDLRTDATGAGTSRTTVPFVVTSDRVPRSLVLHEEEQTATGPGQAGDAGGRLACVTLTEG
ncbi:MAG: superoxide dismutase family protein [Pseudonocardiaceae bacterium]